MWVTNKAPTPQCILYSVHTVWNWCKQHENAAINLNEIEKWLPNDVFFIWFSHIGWIEKERE